MKIIIITDDVFFDGEAELINILLNEGADRVHLRKPDSDKVAFRRLIEALPTELYPRLSLQDHVGLALEYGIGGVHINSRNPSVPTGFNGLVSRSCHSLEEVASSNDDYVFLSPIYNSISKPGYRSAFTREMLAGVEDRVIALGGVRPENLPEIDNFGFGGVAFLGYIWKDASLTGITSSINLSPTSIRLKMNEIRKYIR